jgi:hypothetical protein
LLAEEADCTRAVEDTTFISRFLGFDSRFSDLCRLFGGGVGSSSSEDELELDDFCSSWSESNIAGRFYN